MDKSYHEIMGKRTEAVNRAIRDAGNIITAERMKDWLRKNGPLLVQARGAVYARYEWEMSRATRASNEFDQAMARLKEKARRFRKHIELVRRFKAKPDAVAQVDQRKKKKSPRMCGGCGKNFDDQKSLDRHVYSWFSCVEKHMEVVKLARLAKLANGA
jgi:hypothetical protein